MATICPTCGAIVGDIPVPPLEDPVAADLRAIASEIRNVVTDQDYDQKYWRVMADRIEQVADRLDGKE